MNLTQKQKDMVNYIPLRNYKIACWDFLKTRQNACTVCSWPAWALPDGSWRAAKCPPESDKPVWFVNWVDPDGTREKYRTLLGADFSGELSNQIWNYILVEMDEANETRNQGMIDALYAWLVALNGVPFQVNELARLTKRFLYNPGRGPMRMFYNVKSNTAWLENVSDETKHEASVIECGNITCAKTIAQLTRMLKTAVDDFLATAVVEWRNSKQAIVWGRLSASYRLERQQQERLMRREAVSERRFW